MMMKYLKLPAHTNHWMISFFLPVLCLVVSFGADAAGFGKPYVWHEHGNAHQVWIDPSTVAEITSGQGAAVVRLSAVTPGVRAVASPWHHVRLWKVPEGQSTQQVAAAVANAGDIAVVAVFRDAPDSRAPMRILGYELVATFPTSWSHAKIHQWVIQKSFVMIRKLSLDGQSYVLRSPLGGAQLLQLVNTLEQSGGPVAVYPNWLRPVTLR